MEEEKREEKERGRRWRRHGGRWGSRNKECEEKMKKRKIIID